MNKILINISLILMFASPALAQDQELKREVTLYNPYIPSLSDFQAFSCDHRYQIVVKAGIYLFSNNQSFQPGIYSHPIKTATMEPDPLEKLYKSYVNLGLGNYFLRWLR